MEIDRKSITDTEYVEGLSKRIAETVGHIGIMFLQRTLEQGEQIEIPSLNVIIRGTDMNGERNE